MKSTENLSGCCINCIDPMGNYNALHMVMSLCKRRGWLHKMFTDLRLFEDHPCNMRFYWSSAHLDELVMIIMLLDEKGYIKPRRSRGYWSIIERHLCDFEGNPILRSLSDIKGNILKYPDDYSRKWKRVLKMFSRVEAKYPPKK